MSYTKTFGAVQSPVDIRDYTYKVAAVSSRTFPDEYQIPYLPRVKNQGIFPKCTSYAMAFILEYHNYIQNGVEEDMSIDALYGNRENSVYEGDGAIVRDVAEVAVICGDCYSYQFESGENVPEVIESYLKNKERIAPLALPHAGTKYFRIRNTNELKAALMDYGPVLFSIPWYNDMKYSKGLISSELRDDSDCGYHCMAIYGWDKNGFKFQNSWGKGWGNKGRAVMPYDFKIAEAWGFVDNRIEGADNIDEHYKNWPKWFIKIINKVINTFKYIIKKIIKIFNNVRNK